MFDGFGHGANRNALAGLPHFRDVRFIGRFPVADLVFADAHFPGKIRVTAFSPFIPHRERDSGMPVACFAVEIVNDTQSPLDYTLAGTLGNYRCGSGHHTFTHEGTASILHLASAEANLPDCARGDLAIATDCADVDHTDYHYRGRWFDDLSVFWREFSQAGRLPQRSYAVPREAPPGERQARAWEHWLRACA